MRCGELGLTLACVKLTSRIGFAVELLAKFGLAEHFKVVLGGDSVRAEEARPVAHADCVRKTRRAARAKPLPSVTPKTTRWRAARAGMATLTVPYGYNHGKSVQLIKTDGIVSSPARRPHRS